MRGNRNRSVHLVHPSVSSRVLIAEYGGRCKCKRRFRTGDTIKWDADALPGEKVTECPGCVKLRNHTQNRALMSRLDPKPQKPWAELTFDQRIRRIREERFEILDDE